MTLTTYVRWLLDNNWTPDRSADGRVKDVPKPNIIRENRTRKERGRTAESVVVKDGGPTGREPVGFGWVAENLESRVSLDCRAKDRKDGGTNVDGYERLFGYRNDAEPGSGDDQYGLAPGEAESWGGIVGEIAYILASVRDGDQEFDLVNGFEYSDISNTVGRGNYRSVYEIRLTEYARTIGVPTSS